MNFYESAKALGEALTNSPEFAELKQAKREIDKNRELKNKVDEFKKKEQSIYTSRLTEKQVQLMVEELNKTFAALSKITEVTRFLKAETEFNSLLLKANKVITDTIQARLS